MKTALSITESVLNASDRCDEFCSLVEQIDDRMNYSMMNRSMNKVVEAEKCTKNVVQLCGVSSVPCGYCRENKQTNESVSYGVYFDRLKASDYLLLLNEGWRRSGKHLYKPYNGQSCCPCYSIRLPVSEFQPNKQQRKIWKRMQHLISPSNDNTTAKSSSTRQPESTFVVDPDILSSISGHLEKAVIQNYGQDFISFLLSSSSSSSNNNQRKRTLKSLCQFQVWKNIPKQYLKQFPSTTTTTTKSHSLNNNIIVASTHVAVALKNLMQNSKNIDAKISAASSIAQSIVEALPSQCYDNEDYTIHVHPSTGQIHLWISPTIAQKRPRSFHNSTNNSSKSNDVQETLRNYFSSSASSTSDNGSRFKMVVKCVPSNISALQPEVHRLFVEYQSKIHGDRDPFILPEESRRKRKQTSHKNKYEDDDWDDTNAVEEDNICNDALTSEDFDSIYSSYSVKQRKSIYKNYVAFYRFLCESPLSHTDDDTGCFHLQYFVHDEERREEQQKHLVAVGVVDVLPTCVSSVYAFYDPELSKHLELGKLTALYEINWTKDQRRREFYYLGYYIHSCIKMKYKAQYRPSQLLCLSHYKWVEFDEAKKRIEQFFPKYCPTLYQHHNKKKRHTPTKNDHSLTAPQDTFYYATDDHFTPKTNTEPFSCHHVKSDKKNIIENLLLDIGEASIVSASMLSPQDRAMINPVLSEFVDKICLSVAQSCIIRLSD